MKLKKPKSYKVYIEDLDIITIVWYFNGMRATIGDIHYTSNKNYEVIKFYLTKITSKKIYAKTLSEYGTLSDWILAIQNKEE